ncbi:hypothetical protein RB596_009620 [Gaeumannomyces avenae]
MVPPAQLPTRRMGKDGPQVAAMGFGTMSLGIGFGSGPTASDEERLAVLDRAWELGATHWDTADVYGDSEDLMGKWFRLHPERRNDIYLATKFSMRLGADGTWGFNTSPEYCRTSCESSLRRLGVDHIDLFYIHRLNPDVPIEKTMAVMAELVSEGKVRQLGISECSSRSLRRAHAVHPIAAVQVEYNPFDLAIEGAEGTHLLQACRELGVSVVCYSPLSRGLMTGTLRSRADLDPADYRLALPRYSEDNFHHNLEIVANFEAMARAKSATPAQIALAWLLAQGDDIMPIPGTKRAKHIEENVGATRVTLTPEEEKQIRRQVDKANVKGSRLMPGFAFEFVDTAEL